MLRRQQDGGLFKTPPYPGYPFLMIPDLGGSYLSNGSLSPGARTVSGICTNACFFYFSDAYLCTEWGICPLCQTLIVYGLKKIGSRAPIGAPCFPLSNVYMRSQSFVQLRDGIFALFRYRWPRGNGILVWIIFLCVPGGCIFFGRVRKRVPELFSGDETKMDVEWALHQNRFCYCPGKIMEVV